MTNSFETFSRSLKVKYSGIMTEVTVTGYPLSPEQIQLSASIVGRTQSIKIRCGDLLCLADDIYRILGVKGPN